MTVGERTSLALCLYVRLQLSLTDTEACETRVCFNVDCDTLTQPTSQRLVLLLFFATSNKTKRNQNELCTTRQSDHRTPLPYSQSFVTTLTIVRHYRTVH